MRGLRSLVLEDRLERGGVDERARTGVGEDLAEERNDRERITHGADGHEASERTPTMMWGSSLSSTGAPTMFGSDLNLFVQVLWLNSTIRCAPSTASASVKTPAELRCCDAAAGRSEGLTAAAERLAGPSCPGKRPVSVAAEIGKTVASPWKRKIGRQCGPQKPPVESRLRWLPGALVVIV